VRCRTHRVMSRGAEPSASLLPNELAVREST
jgi:hypothetical protein